MADFSVPEAKAEMVRLRNKGSKCTAAEKRTLRDLERIFDATGGTAMITTARDYTPPKKKGFFSR